MSLQKGKIWPRVQPWTATNNWRMDSKPSRRIKAYGVIDYAGFQLSLPGTISELYTFGRPHLTFQWIIPDFGIPFTTFSARILVFFVPGTPLNRTDVQIIDHSGGILQFSIIDTDNQFLWDDDLRHFPGDRFNVSATGSFQGIEEWGYSNVRYSEEPR